MARKIDDLLSRGIIKDEYFNGKRSATDEYTGERIFDGNKPGGVNKHNTLNKANVDHVVSIHQINKKYGDLDEYQRTELANSRENLAVTNEHLNKAKGSMSNREFIKSQRDKGQPLDRTTERNMRNRQTKAEISMGIKAARMRMENKIEDKHPEIARYFDRYDPEDDDDDYDV